MLMTLRPPNIAEWMTPQHPSLAQPVMTMGFSHRGGVEGGGCLIGSSRTWKLDIHLSKRTVNYGSYAFLVHRNINVQRTIDVALESVLALSMMSLSIDKNLNLSHNL